MFEKYKQEKAAKQNTAAVATWECEDESLRSLLSVVVNVCCPFLA